MKPKKVKNRCASCGFEISPMEVFDEEYTYCRSYCCGCCPTKNGYRGESCHKDFMHRQKGRPVGFLEWAARNKQG